MVDEKRIDELYAAPIEDFIPARTRLAKELKDGGDSEGAALVRSLRKPSVAAWTVNQLARRNRREIDALVRAGEELRSAQRKALAGGGGKALQEAGARRREAVDRLVKEAAEVLGSGGHAATRARLDEVANTLLAVATDDAAAKTVREGRLEKEFLPPSGFGEEGDLAAVISFPDRRAKESSRRGREKETPRERKQAAPAAIEDAGPSPAARRRAEARAKRVQGLKAEAERAQAEAARLSHEADRAESEALRLHDEADLAEKAAARARREADRAATRARSARERAEKALEKGER